MLMLRLSERLGKIGFQKTWKKSFLLTHNVDRHLTNTWDPLRMPSVHTVKDLPRRDGAYFEMNCLLQVSQIGAASWNGNRSFSKKNREEKKAQKHRALPSLGRINTCVLDYLAVTKRDPFDFWIFTHISDKIRKEKNPALQNIKWICDSLWRTLGPYKHMNGLCWFYTYLIIVIHMFWYIICNPYYKSKKFIHFITPLCHKQNISFSK